MKIKVSHETPMCLLEDSLKFNDYDYCLPHLLDEEPKYLEFFRKAKANGRYIIMDNSLHELGEAYNHERLIHWINEIKPNEFIVPDVWEHASYYNDICTRPNKDLGKALGRLFVVSTLLKTGELRQDDRIHLLGCAVPQEFGWYKDINCIETIDTSNPVMATLEDVQYKKSGLDKKPKANMNDYFYMLDDQVDFDLLSYNLKMFKMINNL